VTPIIVINIKFKTFIEKVPLKSIIKLIINY
jgi:hypothetical protein